MSLQWSTDVAQASWWIARLRPVVGEVAAVVPGGFGAYARVFHPIEDGDARRTWADLAATNERLVHPEMQLHEISRSRGAPRPERYEQDGRVEWGSLPRSELEALSRVLGSHTTTPERCWCCVWEGYGRLRGGGASALLTYHDGGVESAPLVPSNVLDGPRVRAPGRSYFLLHGPLARLGSLFDQLGAQSPNVWWPEDRAWFVATEVDVAWTYVAGSMAAVEGVLGDPHLESLPAAPSDRCTYGSDLANAALDGPEPTTDDPVA